MKRILSFIVLAAGSLLATKAYPQEPTLQIESLDVAQGERTVQSVSVVVRNVTTETQAGMLWYVLASPGEPEPWRVHAYASSERPISVSPGRTMTVELAAPSEPLDGRFALSVWLHGTHPGTSERFHADMRPHDTPVVVAPPLSFSVDYLESPQALDGQKTILVRFNVRNNQERTAKIGLDYRITPKEEIPDPDMRQLRRTAEIDSGVDYVVTIRHTKPLALDSLKLTAWVYELVDGRLLYRGTDVTPIEPRD